MNRDDAIDAVGGPIRIVALYRFTRFDDCEAVKHALLDVCRDRHVKGTLIVAGEGLNGTIAGTDDAIEAVLAHIRALPGCADIDVKESRAPTMPFHRLKVRIKREIVTMGRPAIDPLNDAGHYVAPQDWNALIDDPDTILIDTRNDYEVAIGSFVGAIDPETRSFREFPAWLAANRDTLSARGADAKIAMFCTGGIRCEKATALLKAEGLANVYHLKGGILAYLEATPAEDSRWQGECFVFDERVAVTAELGPGSHLLCRACRMPVGPDAQASPDYVEGIACPACRATRTDAQRQGYAERHRQTQLAASRGDAHVGAVLPQRHAD